MDIDSLQHSLSVLNLRVEALGKVITKLENDNAVLRNQILVLEAEKKQWEDSKTLQNTIIAQAVGNNNDLMQRQAVEIQELRDRLRKYEGD